MPRACRNEALCILAAGLVLLVLGAATGRTQILLVGGLAVYAGWHVLNFVLLQRWISHSRRFQLPVSLGVWEEIFDGLQRRQLRHRRRRSNLVRRLREFRNAGEQLPDALVLLSDDNAVLGFNAAAGKLLALRPKDRGRRVTDLIRHPRFQDAVTGAGPSQSMEIASPANGAWMLSLQTTASFGESRRRMLIARDITPFHGIEKARREFVADVSHELRTPITVFRGYLGALRQDPGSPQWDVPLRSMDEQAQRMQLLVDDLLLLSRLEMTRQAQPADLMAVTTVLEEIVEQARVLSGDKGHRLALDADATVSLWGDEGELRSAFSNLVFNAVRHTSPGTSITVTWEGSPDHACLTVRDFGPGIAAHHLPRLTERFYRVDSSRSRDGGGTGLGLAIVKHVMNAHDAKLTVESELGEGSTFTCTFPPGRSVEISQAKAASQ
jgi:two-component system phosphate regulon sensor histidine kinase PhoR